MKKSTTKRALLSSVLALVMCFGMLTGTTFAWFTDTVTSGSNIIAAGNLDVELYHTNRKDTKEVVDSSTKLFDEVNPELWEPGAMAYEVLTVENKGSLALKYQLTLNALGATEVTDADGNKHSFASMLKVAVVKNNTDYTYNRATIVADTNLVWKDLATFTLDGKLEAKAENATVYPSEVFGIIIWWQPSDNDNLFNMNNGKTETVSVDVGVSLVATQMSAESDAFDNTYDEDAWVEGMKVLTGEDLQAAINAGETNITLMDDIELDEPIVIPAAPTTYSLRNATPAVVIDLNGKNITTAYNETTGKHAYAIDNYGSLVINGGTIEARGIYNREDATLTVNGTKIVNLDMNGGSCIWSYGGEVYINDATLIGYTGCVYSEGYLEINGGTYTCYSGVTDDGVQVGPTYNIRSTGELVINGGDFTSRHGLLAIKGSAEINGGTYTMTSIGVITSHVFYVYGDSSNVVVNGGTFNCDLRTAQANGSSMIYVDAANVTVNVYGGTFNLTPAKYVATGFKAVETPNGYMVIPSDSNYVADGVLVSTDGNTYYISNRAGYEWVESQADNFFGNKTIALTNDIDFGGDTIPSIGFWNSHPTFDGQGHTLSNLTVAQTGMNSSSGLFAGTFNVKNLNVDKASVKGTYAGVISGWMYGNIDNCTVKNSTVNNTFWQGGGLVAQYNSGNVTNCTVENCTISGGSAVGGLIGILNETAGERKVENCTVKNCTISMNGGFGGDYDNYFGVAVGLINIENSKVYFNNCTLEQNTLKGAESTVIYGEAESGTEVFVNGAQVVSTSDELVAALANGKDVIFANDITMAAKTTNSYGVTGIVVDGQTIDGNGYTFKVTGAGATWDSAIYIKGGKIENLKITGAMRGVFMGTANADVYLENVSFGTIYTFNSDGGNNNFGVYISNSTMNGWTSHSNVHKEVVYTNCVFTEGSGYKYCRPYGPTKFIDCTFTEGFTVDKSQTTELVFENCIFE